MISVARVNGDYRVLIKALLSGGENLLLGNYSGGRKVYLATALVAVRRSRYLNPDVVWVERCRRPLSKKSLSLSLSLPLSLFLSLSLSLSLVPFLCSFHEPVVSPTLSFHRDHDLILKLATTAA